MKPLSDQLTYLSRRAKEAEDEVAAAKMKGAAKIRQREDEIQAEAARRMERARQQASDGQDKVASEWSGIKGKVQSDVDRLRARIDLKKQQADRGMADKVADEAEASAMQSIDFAIYAIDNAETAVLDATIARDMANSF